MAHSLTHGACPHGERVTDNELINTHHHCVTDYHLSYKALPTELKIFRASICDVIKVKSIRVDI